MKRRDLLKTTAVGALLGRDVAFGRDVQEGRPPRAPASDRIGIGMIERPAGNPFTGPWKLHSETALPHPSCPFVVEDLDRDGRLDIVFGRGHDYGLYWWEQQAPRADGTTVWKQHVIDESWSQAHALALADLDGDGREELIAGKCIWAHEGGDPGARDTSRPQLTSRASVSKESPRGP